MTRKQRKLQWHHASRQWCKRRNGKVYYVGKGTLTRDKQGGMLDHRYDAALAHWQRIADGLDASNGTGPPQPLVYPENITSSETPQSPASAEDRTVAKQVASFLAFKLRQAKANQRSGGRMINLMLYVGQFRDWLGPTVTIDAINTQTLRAYYDHLLDCMNRPNNEGITSFSAKDAFQVAKQFIRWLAENSLISSLPANINSRELIFIMPPGKKVNFSAAEFRYLLDLANDRMRLFLLLMANCGMTQKDIADLTPDEVDWQFGLIRRKRSKTKHVQSVEVVTYKLWPETFNLLQRLGQRTGERVFLGKNKLPLAYRGVRADGTSINVDAIASAYVRLREKAGTSIQSKSLTDLRNTSSTLLHNSRFHHLRDLFLGHAAKTTAEKFYAANYDDRLDLALEFLRKELLMRDLQPDELVA